MALSGGSWGTREELLHPRDKAGRFRRKWSLPTATVDKIMSILDRFQPPTFRSQQQASQWAFNQSAKLGPKKFQDFDRLGADFTNTNADLRAGRMTPSTQKFVNSFERSSFESDTDMVVYRKVGPEAFGITPEMMNQPEGGIEDVLTGTTIVDKGYTSGNVGAPIGNAPITMAIAAPKGTKMMAPARSPGDPQIILDRDQKLHVSKVEPDGRGGFNVMAIITDEPGPEKHEVVSQGEPPSTQEREAGVTELNDIRQRRMGAKTDEQTEREEAERQAGARAGQVQLEQEQQQRVARMGTDRPVPTPAGVAPRTEPLQSEMLGGRPATPAPTPEEPEDVRVTDFREAFRTANIEVPSAGPRRREFNKAYTDIIKGKRDPEDVLRELEADIRDNNARMDEATTGETPRLEAANLEADIQRQEALADLIAEHRGLERRAPAAGPPKPKEGDIPEEGASKGGTDISGMTEAQKDNILNRFQRLQAEGRINPENEEHQRQQNLVDQITAEREGREIPAPFEQPPVSGTPAAKAAKKAAKKAAAPAKRAPAKKAAAPAKKVAPAKAVPETEEGRLARIQEILRGENLPGEEEEADPLESMTREQLVAEAGRRGIDRVPSSWNKTKIKDAIRQGEVKAKAAPATKATSAEATEAGDLDNMLKKDLIAEATRRDVEVKDWWTKDRIKQAIRGEAPPAPRKAGKKAAPIPEGAPTERVQEAARRRTGADLTPEQAQRLGQAERQRSTREKDLDAIAEQLRGVFDEDSTRPLTEGLTTNELRQVGAKLGITTFRSNTKPGMRDDIAAEASMRGLSRVRPADLSGEGRGSGLSPEVVSGPRGIRRRADGLNFNPDGIDQRMMDALERKQSGEDTIFRGNDIGRPLTDVELADEIDDMLKQEAFSGDIKARRLFQRAQQEENVDLDVLNNRMQELREKDRQWRRLANRLRGRHQETGIDNPASARKVTAEDRRASLSNAFDQAFPALTPDTAARRSILEIRDDVISGRITPDEGVRRLESDIEFNKEELASIEADLRGTDNPAEMRDLRRMRAMLTNDVKQQEKASAFMRRHFRQAPEITPGEVKQALPEPMQRQLDAVNPAELKQTAEMTGLPGLKGDTKEELQEDLLSQLAEKVKADRPAPKKVAPPKAPAEVTPTVPDRKYQRTDIDALAEGLDLTDPDDRKILDGLQKQLDAEKISPAQLGRNLQKTMSSGGGLRGRAAFERVQGDPDSEGRAQILERRATEFEKLGERLTKVRRKANKGPQAPPPKPDVTPDEKRELDAVADLTGIPAADLEKRALAKKEADAPPKPISVQTTEVLDTIDDEQEQRALLSKKLKAELVDIAKADGIRVLSKDTRPVIIGKILDKRKAKQAVLPSGDDLGPLPTSQSSPMADLRRPEVRAEDVTPVKFDYNSRSTSGLDDWSEDDKRDLDAALKEWVFHSSDAPEDRTSENAITRAARSGNLTPEMERQVGLIDRAIDQSRTTEDLTLYRGFQNGTAMMPDDWESRDLTGLKWNDKGFTSATDMFDSAEVYVGDKKDRGFGIRFRYPKGSPGIGIRDEPGGLDDEGEIGLPRNMNFEVVRDRGEQDGIRWLDVKVTPGATSPAKQAAPAKKAAAPTKKAVTPLQAPPAERPLTAEIPSRRVSMDRKSSAPKMANSWGRPGNRQTEVLYHGDSGVGRAINALGEDQDIEVDGDRLDNVLGKLARENIDGSITQQEMIDRLQALSNRFPQNSVPRRVIDNLADEMDTPDRSLDLPDNLPDPLRQLAENFSKTPLARKEREGKQSDLEKLGELINDWQAGRVTPARLSSRVDALRGNRHESEDGYFDILRALDQAKIQLRSTPRDQLMPPQEPKPVRKPQTPAQKFRNLSNERIRRMSDSQLLELFEFESRKDVVYEERLQFIYDEIGRREEVTELEAAQRVEAESSMRERLDELVEGGMDYRDAYAEAFNIDPEELERQERSNLIDRDRMPGETREQALRRAYKEQIAIAYVQAEAATNGHMLSPAGRAAGIDPYSLFSGPRSRAAKWASDELKEWWEQNGRPTFTEFKGQMEGGRAGRAAIRLAQEGERGFL
jgi:hypothetical protein